MDNQLICNNCSSPVPQTAFFCGICLTQVKCRKCEVVLEKDYMGCINCGTPREVKDGQANIKLSVNTNTVRISETLTERTIEATFSDNVGKDLAGILKDAYSAKLLSNVKSDTVKHTDRGALNLKNGDVEDAEVLESNENLGSNKPTVNDYPSLKAIAMKNLPNSETEWIVVYAFYASDYGQNIFTREEIINQYIESSRFNKTATRRDLATYIKRAVVQEFINPLQKGFSILDKGIDAAKEIISRTGSSTPKVAKRNSKSSQEASETTDSVEKQSKGKKSGNGNKPLKRLSNIDFYPKGKDSLEAFYKKYSAKNDHERNLLFVHYLQEVLNITGISYDHIYTCYDDLKLRVPENIHQAVRNTKSKTGWIDKDSKGFRVAVKGGNQIKTWNKKG